MKYSILHPVNGEMNHNCTVNSHSYEKVAEIEASNKDQAFTKCQNFNPEYSKLGARSTSVGDILVESDGSMYMVEDMGFTLLCNCEHILEEINYDYRVSHQDIHDYINY